MKAKTNSLTVSGNLIDIHKDSIYPAQISVLKGRIISVKKKKRVSGRFILPGLVDAHIHIESSLLPPSEFARLAVLHGTVATVSDPHEIANVLGIKGVEYMVKNGRKAPLKFYFGAPSCVPATTFETNGARIDKKAVSVLLGRKDIYFLSEVMDYPAVIKRNKDIMEKIKAAQRHSKPIDGHAPGLTGPNLKKYVTAGISTDHESFWKDEAIEKIKLGMKIIIREGSAAKNYDALISSIKKYPKMCMFGSDDLHPHELLKGHINLLVKRAISHGFDLMDTIRCATLNPVNHYHLDIGLLKVGDPADFIIIDSPGNFRVLKTYINGQLVAGSGRVLFQRINPAKINLFRTKPKNISDFQIPAKKKRRLKVIEAYSGQLVTGKITVLPKILSDQVVSDPKNDILKITVVNRYRNVKPAVAFIKNFGLKKGAIASSVAHDSHNIIAVGATDQDIKKAVNTLIKNKGGFAVSSEGKIQVLPLPIAGLMSAEPIKTVAEKYQQLEKTVRSLGCRLTSPFMTLSFMSLLVIPHLKLSDRGLFDVDTFKLTNLQE